MRIRPGFYRARAISLEFVSVGEKATKAAAVAFSILDRGPHEGDIIEWKGWLSEKARERTAESLVYCGFDGENPQSVTKNEVQIVVDDEEYTNPETGKTSVSSRVQWVNDPSRGHATGRPMNELERAEAISSLRGLVLAKKQELEKNRTAKDDGASFGFGHNAPAEGGSAAPAAGSPGGSKPMF